MPRPFPPIRTRRSAALVAVGLLLGAGGVVGGAAPAQAFGRSLDEVFRGTLRAENEGTLPGYVLNRGLPPYPDRKPLTPEEAAAQARNQPLDLPNMGGEMPWPQVVQEVAAGAPSPFAVQAVRRKAEGGDGAAVELLAWMNANGVGVRRDLGSAFTLYMRAEELGVKGAKDNAQAIYKAMPAEARRTVFNPYR